MAIVFRLTLKPTLPVNLIINCVAPPAIVNDFVKVAGLLGGNTTESTSVSTPSTILINVSVVFGPSFFSLAFSFPVSVTELTAPS